MKLSDTAIRNARARDKPYKLADGRGLVLLIQPTGAKWWRYRYRYEGREKMISLGAYPTVTLQLARDRLRAAQRSLAEGCDPSVARRLKKADREFTFASVAREWLDHQQATLAPATYRKAKWVLEDLLLPRLGTRPVSQIGAAEVLTVLRGLDERGLAETARRARQRCGQVLRYAIATGRADRDVTADLRGALRPVRPQHHAAITEPARIAELIRAIHGFQGQPATVAALKLAPLLFVRPGELRGARWTEFDFARSEWRIPAERMKMREVHLVPLSRQAIEILEELRAHTGDRDLLFPCLTSASRPMSENTVNAALRRLGYGREEMTGHGFRTLASTALNELGWSPDLIELQLAHRERNKVRDAYNRASRLGERRRMMQAWADYLDSLRLERGSARLSDVA